MLNRFLDKYVYTNNLVFKDYNFFLADVPFVIMPVDLLVAIAGKWDFELHQELYDQVKKSVWKSLIPKFNLDSKASQERILNFTEVFFTAGGWGQINQVQVDTPNTRAVISVSRSPIALSLQHKVEDPCDHFMRGILAGIFSHAFNQEVDCVETRCVAQGNSNCEFILQKAGTLDFSKKEVREQLKASV